MRDKLIELIGDALVWDVMTIHEAAQKIADRLIFHGVTFADVPETNVGKWIPVSERLPDCEWGAECPEPVLYKMKGTGTVYAGYYGTGGVWRDRYFREYGRNSVDVDDVACWMYQSSLPEPPKEGE